MHLLSFFDTETTGLWNKKLAITHTAQPHIVQLATLVTDSCGNEVTSFNRIIKPQGYTTIDPGAFEVHGITFERAMDEGIDRRLVLDEWRDLVRPTHMLIAHNKEFDLKLMEIAMRREYNDVKQSYRYKKQFCTMKTYTDICKLPPTDRMLQYGFNTYKSPKLQEAYKHVFGEEFEDAHDAMADVRACAKIFFALPRKAWIRHLTGKDE